MLLFDVTWKGGLVRWFTEGAGFRYFQHLGLVSIRRGSPVDCLDSVSSSDVAGSGTNQSFLMHCWWMCVCVSGLLACLVDWNPYWFLAFVWLIDCCLTNLLSHCVFNWVDLWSDFHFELRAIFIWLSTVVINADWRLKCSRDFLVSFAPLRISIRNTTSLSSVTFFQIVSLIVGTDVSWSHFRCVISISSHLFWSVRHYFYQFIPECLFHNMALCFHVVLKKHLTFVVWQRNFY